MDAQCDVMRQVRASCMVNQWQVKNGGHHEKDTVTLESRVR